MFEHILVPIDGSSLAECVLPHVAAIASAFDAKVTLLRVISISKSETGFVDPLEWQMERAEAQNYLEKIQERLKSSFKISIDVNAVILDGGAADQIIEFARTNQIDLIILSSHGKSGLSKWNVSSVVQKVIQRANLPTFLIRAYQSKRLEKLSYETIMVPLDSSQRAECTFPIIARLAQFHQSKLLFAHVVVRPEMPHRMPLTENDKLLAEQLTERKLEVAKNYFEQLKNRLASQRVDIQTHLIVGEQVASALHDMVDQENVDLVILSAHGYSGETRWPYGNVVENFIQYGTTPLLIYQDFDPQELQPTLAETVVMQDKGH